MFSINNQSFVARCALILILIIRTFGVIPARADSVTRYVKWNVVGTNDGKSGTDAYLDHIVAGVGTNNKAVLSGFAITAKNTNDYDYPAPFSRTSGMHYWNGNTLPDNWLERFNYYRQAAGLPLVVESPAYSADLANHVNYMLLNVPTEGLWHGETLGLPGYTAEGAQAAAESNLFWFPSGVSYTTPAITIDGWMASIHHRYGMLRPDLVTTGYGFGCDSQNCSSGLNVIRGIVWDSTLRPNGVIYPGPNQVNVNRDIIITWQFTGQSTVALINASLKNPLQDLNTITTEKR